MQYLIRIGYIQRENAVLKHIQLGIATHSWPLRIRNHAKEGEQVHGEYMDVLLVKNNAVQVVNHDTDNSMRLILVRRICEVPDSIYYQTKRDTTLILF